MLLYNYGRYCISSQNCKYNELYSKYNELYSKFQKFTSNTKIVLYLLEKRGKYNKYIEKMAEKPSLFAVQLLNNEYN